ncbi:hypothetical protein N665_1382s0003 [Sinapis alba]|nr:hypothetical protein N665_1382s0003 [Sinapis alba]
MDRYKCRFCFKSFINGSALGGHMRSHMLTLSSKRDLYQEEEEMPSQLSEETESDASSSSDEDDDPRVHQMVDDKEMEFGFSESETESSRSNTTRRRSKRTRKLGSFDFDFKKVKTSQAGETEHHHSSASDTTTEEDLAFCLIMLSRDKWKQHKKKTVVEQEEEEDDDESDHECKNRGGRGRFKCETCGKVFKSYQALGGHRASHKKNKTFTKTELEKTEYSVNGVNEKKIHQCPICFRVFSSGQALGGHKRSHGISNNIVSGRVLSVNHIIPTEVSVKQRMIDLNLPAPNEDVVETSVVFDEW